MRGPAWLFFFLLASVSANSALQAQCIDPSVSRGTIICYALKGAKTSPDPLHGQTIRIGYEKLPSVAKRLAIFQNLALITTVPPGQNFTYVDWQNGELQYTFEINSNGSWARGRRNLSSR